MTAPQLPELIIDNDFDAAAFAAQLEQLAELVREGRVVYHSGNGLLAYKGGDPIALDANNYSPLRHALLLDVRCDMTFEVRRR